MSLLAALHDRFVNTPRTVKSAIHGNHTPHTRTLGFPTTLPIVYRLALFGGRRGRKGNERRLYMTSRLSSSNFARTTWVSGRHWRKSRADDTQQV